MRTEHERAQEALAARALRALDGSEQAAAEDLLERHLPGCDECRGSLQDFDAIAGELALGVPARRPPGLLAARIRRDARSVRERRRLPALATVAAVAVLLGMGLWNAHLAGRMSRAERQQASTAELISVVTHPASRVVPIPAVGAIRSGIQVSAIVGPGRSLYVVGAMPPPQSNRTYQLWLGRSGVFRDGGTFMPGPVGFVLLRLRLDASAYDRLLITEERAEGSERPSDQHVVETSI